MTIDKARELRAIVGHYYVTRVITNRSVDWLVEAYGLEQPGPDHVRRSQLLERAWRIEHGEDPWF